MTEYTAVYEHDGDEGVWLAEIEEISGVHTFGRTLTKAQENLRDALALWLEVDEAALPSIRATFKGRVGEAVGKALAAREALDAATTEARRTTLEAVNAVRASGGSMRDAAQMLGLSHQRVHQLAMDQNAVRIEPSRKLPARKAKVAVKGAAKDMTVVGRKPAAKKAAAKRA